jgi:hypothetical protein
MSFTFGESTTVDVDVTLDYDGAPKDNAVSLTIEVTNRGDSGLDLSQYEIVYYLYEPGLNADEAVWDTYYCDYTEINATLLQMSQSFTTTKQKADKELVLSFPTGTMLPSSRTRNLSTRMRQRSRVIYEGSASIAVFSASRRGVFAAA